MTAPLNLDALEAAARAATPGPWESRHHEVVADGGGRVADVACTRGKYEREKENRDFIAAANPAAVLALIERLRVADAKVQAHARYVQSNYEGELSIIMSMRHGDVMHAVGRHVTKMALRGFGTGTIDHIGLECSRMFDELQEGIARADQEDNNAHS